MRIGLYLAVFTSSQTVVGQTCGLASQFATIDAGGAQFRVSNRGPLLGDRVPPLARVHFTNYETPDHPSILYAYVGFGGYANGNFRMTGVPWSPIMLPGPLDADGLPRSDSLACAEADRIYMISVGDFSTLDIDGRVSEDMADWPAHLGAPVIDGDGIEGNYDLHRGDRPALVGDQMAWWQMNDGGRLNLRRASTKTDRVGIEITAMVSVAKRRRAIDVTLFRYDVRYVGETVLDSAVIFLQAEIDSGSWSDDELRSDSVAGLGYVFTPGDDLVFGDNAPSVGFQFFRGPIVDNDGIDNNHNGIVDEIGEELRPTVISTHNGDYYGESQIEYYRARQGCLPESVMIEGAGCRTRQQAGPQPTITRFWSPDDPKTVGPWEDERVPNDRRVLIGIGPFAWLPGKTQSIEFAVLWVRKESNIESAHAIRGYGRNLLLARDELYKAAIPDFKPEATRLPEAYLVSEPYPNPATGSVIFNVELPEAETMVIKIFDMLGRQVVENKQDLPAGFSNASVDISGIGSGVYRYILSIRSATRVGTLVVAQL